MPDKANAAIPEKWSTRYRGAKAQLHILPPIPLLEEDNYEGVRFQCEEVIELIDELAALTQEVATLKAERDTAIEQFTEHTKAVGRFLYDICMPR